MLFSLQTMCIGKLDKIFQQLVKAAWTHSNAIVLGLFNVFKSIKSTCGK
uniref:Uncharacterized protein n=1 Tax=Anguilla anguilla TaxID=7936 RepID=A0A0E9UFL2_ANGAN